MHPAQIEKAISYLKTGNLALSNDRHAALETFEPPGSIAFQALQSHIYNNLQSDTKSDFIENLQSTLSECPAYLKRDIATAQTMPLLADNPEWPLTRSLTFQSNASPQKLIDHGSSSLAHVENLAFAGGDMDSLFVADVIHKCTSLKSLDLSACALNNELYHGIAERIELLENYYGFSKTDFQGCTSLSLQTVSCNGEPDVIKILNEKSGCTIRDLIISSQANLDELFNTLNELCNAHPLIDNLESLTIYADLDDTSVKLLCHGDNFINLRKLTLCSPLISSKGIEFLSKADFVSRLDYLNLSGCELGAEGWLNLSLIPFVKITTLKLNRCNGNSVGFNALASSSFLNQLTHLELAGNCIDLAGLQMLYQNCSFDNLEYLDLHDNKICDQGIGLLLLSPFIQKLKHLRINGFSSHGMLALSSCLELKCLESLNVGFISDRPTDTKCFVADSPLLNSLLSLSVTGAVNDEMLVELSLSSMSSKLRRLLISGSISTTGVESLSQSNYLHNLWTLGFSHCQLDDNAAMKLSWSTNMSQLNDLRLIYCKLTPKGSLQLSKSEIASKLRWISMEKSLLSAWLTNTKASSLLIARIQEYLK